MALQNIKALRQMLDGEHRLQKRTTVGFSDTDSAKTKKHEVGETWEEITASGVSVEAYYPSKILGLLK